MRNLTINAEAISTSASNAQFIVLGAPEITAPAMRPVLNAKINMASTDHIPGVWATLGMADSGEILWQGNLVFSKTGNDQSQGKTLEQIEHLYRINDELNNADSVVTERFINFDQVHFPEFPKTFKADEIPNLRLTLFLQPDEGALVFYQHFKDTYENDDGSDLEYILPEPTPDHTTNRDRLTYIFPILPPQKIEETGNDGILTLSPHDLGKSFVVKVLTFKRDNDEGHADVIVNNMLNKVNQGQNDHKLLKFLYTENKFTEVNNTDALLDPAVKTLLLFHGTFSSTDNSFNGLLKQQYDGKSWLQKTMDSHGYMQVLALDHPTVSYDAKGNIEELMKILNGMAFTGAPHVDVITTSRGGLVGKYLTCCLAGSQLPVRRMANIACANGVGYFDTGRSIAKFLSLLRAFFTADGSPLAAGVAAVAQFSAEYFLSQPGCQQMTIGNPRLTDIITKTPTAANKDMVIQPIVGDWDASLVASENLIKRLLERGLDALTKLSLGAQNDWVVGTDKQKIAPPSALPPIQVRSMHVRYLNSDICPDHVHQILWNFFDSPTANALP